MTLTDKQRADLEAAKYPKPVHLPADAEFQYISNLASGPRRAFWRTPDGHEWHTNLDGEDAVQMSTLTYFTNPAYFTRTTND